MDSMGAPLGPGDLQSIFECLQGSLNQKTSVQKQAEAALHALETRPGFCSCLAEIILSKDADHSARWLAAVHLKNSVNKYWRSRMPGSLTEDEKTHLRNKFLLLLDQEDSQIGVQTSVVLAKVARLDYPKAWPALFIELLGRLQAAVGAGPAGTLTVRRTYLALHHTLKELASKRLAADQRAFEAVTSQLLEPLWGQWVNDTNVLTSGLPSALVSGAAPAAQQTLLLTFERWLLQLKSLRRMLLFGFPCDSKTMEQVPAVAQVVPQMLTTLQALLSLAPSATAPRSQLAAMLDRGSVKLVKTLRQVQEMHPWSTLHSGALGPLLELACTQVSTPSMRPGQVGDQFIRQCLLLISGAVRCPSYRGSSAALALAAGKAREQTQRLKELAAEAAPVLQAFWAPRQEALLRVIVTKLFPLTPNELEMWEDSGEELHQELSHGGQDDSVRGCAEQAFSALLESDRAHLGPVVMDILQRSGDSTSNGSAAGGVVVVNGVPLAVLTKAAAYHAVAIGAYELHDYIDFSAWLHSSLLQEMSDPNPTLRPLRRAAVKVLAYWAPKLKKQDRPGVYRSLVAALADPDPAIHLAAASTLHALVEDWEFDSEQFTEYVATVFQLLAGLLHTSTEYEAQLEAFSLINAIIDKLGSAVASHAGGLLQLLPVVWASAEGQSLLRIQVLLAMQRVVHSLGAESPAAYPILLPILQVATDPAQPDGLNLLEDGLLLWLVALRHAPAPHPGLIAPLPHLLDAMQHSTEYMAVGTRLISSCVLLGGREVLAAHGAHIVAVLTGFIGNVKDRGMLCLLPVMDLVLQSFPQEGPSLLAPALQALLADLLGGQEPGPVIAQGLGIFARLILVNPRAFLATFQAAAPQLAGGLGAPAPGDPSDPSHRLLLAFLDLWLDKFDSIGQPASRKLSSLALCALLAVPVPQILQRMDTFAAHVTSVWYELEGPEAGAGAGFTLDFYSAGSGPRDDDIPVAVDLDEAEGETSRRRVLFEHSPVPNLRLGAFAKTQFEAAAGVHGSAVNEALNALDPALGGQVREMLSAAETS